MVKGREKRKKEIEEIKTAPFRDIEKDVLEKGYCCDICDKSDDCKFAFDLYNCYYDCMLKEY